MEIGFAKLSKFFFGASLIYLLIFIFLLSSKKMNLGIDFVGGHHVELSIKHELVEEFTKLDLPGSISQISAQKNYQNLLLKIPANHDIKNIQSNINEKFGDSIHYDKIEFVGPQISRVIINSAMISVAIALALMFIYLLVRFNFLFALGGVYALIHDVIFVLGMLCLTRIEVTIVTISAILTIIGYSINDTVVIFDRIRENKKRHIGSVKNVIDKSIKSTLKRTTLTSLTTLVSAVVLFFIGGDLLRDFSYTILIGIIIGTYSSIFISIFPLRMNED